MNKVRKVNQYPPCSLILEGTGKPDYFDSYQTVKATTGSIDEITTKLFKTPAWVGALGKLRNLMVKPFGLKTEKDIEKERSEIDLAPVLFRNDHELVMGLDDKHLSFRISVFEEPAGTKNAVSITTVVWFNHWGGRVYFALIKPFHCAIIRTMLRRL